MVAMVAAGECHTCAIDVNGKLVCFGHNDDGQCNVPCDLGPVKAVAAGQTHACAGKGNGQLACFGSNSHGQCSPPPWLDSIVSVAAGAYHTCAVQASGMLVCFGIKDGSVMDEGQCNVPVGLRVRVNLQPLPLQLSGKSSVKPVAAAAQQPMEIAEKQNGRWCSSPDLDAVTDAEVGEVATAHATFQNVQHTEIAAEISPLES